MGYGWRRCVASFGEQCHDGEMPNSPTSPPQALDDAWDVAPEAQGIDAWLHVFRRERVAVELAIHQRLPLERREAILRSAQAAMPDEGSDDVVELEAIATKLEVKLDEMLTVLLGRAAGPLSKVRLPPALEVADDLELLRHPICRDERRWLFVGRMLEILDQYRGHGRSLVLEQRKRLLDRLEAGVKTVTSTVQKLDSYLVVEQAFDLDQRAQVTQMLESVQQLQELYRSTLQSRGDGGLEAVLEDNYYTLKGQFLLACAKLAFQLYGQVAKDHLEALLALKSVYILQVPGTKQEEDQTEEAKRKYLERVMQRALTQVHGRAQRESWPVLPVLRLYKYDSRFGRTPPLHKKVCAAGDGESPGALTDYGASLVSNL